MSSDAANKITLYSRPNCCLCDDAEAVIRKVIPRYNVTFEIVDVSKDEALEQAFGPMVPVVAIDGRVLFYGKVSELRLHRILAGKSISNRYKAFLERFPRRTHSSN